MILQTVFKMFADLKTKYEPIWRQHKKEDVWNISTVFIFFREK